MERPAHPSSQEWTCALTRRYNPLIQINILGVQQMIAISDLQTSQWNNFTNEAVNSPATSIELQVSKAEATKFRNHIVRKPRKERSWDLSAVAGSGDDA